MNELGRSFTALGVVMVAAGVGLLGYLGYTVFLIIDAPEKVGFVKFLLDHLGIDDTVIYGYAGSESFAFNLAEPVRTVVLLFFGVVMFWIIAGIARAIIATGLAIMRSFSSTPPPT